MKILSIDVGIKNLGLCILELEKDFNYTIKYWNVIDLFDEKIKICEYSRFINSKINLCKKPAKYYKNGFCFCKSHASKTDFKFPSINLKKYKTMKSNELKDLLKEYELLKADNLKKNEMINIIENYINLNVLENISILKCNEINLIDIGISIKEKFDKVKSDIFINIDTVLIENQISPIANRMNCIQGMLSQYFIMNNIKNIKFISATNKLKLFIDSNKKTTYSERKKISIEQTKKLLENYKEDYIAKEKNIQMFNKSKKQDDLADCFLQGIWYLNEYYKEKLLL